MLVTRRLGMSKHSGALTLFSREFVKRGLLRRKWARRAFDRRLEADYAELVEFTIADAEDTLGQARTFIDHVRALLPDLLSKGNEDR